MDLPDHGKIEQALIDLFIGRGNKPLSARRASAALAEHFGLSAAQKNLMLITASGSENAWYNRCRTARNHLAKSGIMNKRPRDTWALSYRAFRGRTSTLEELGL